MTPAKVLAFVRANKGALCADVAKRFRSTCALAGAVLRHLRATKRVRSRGNTRGTRYYAA